MGTIKSILQITTDERRQEILRVWRARFMDEFRERCDMQSKSKHGVWDSLAFFPTYHDMWGLDPKTAARWCAIWFYGSQ